MSATMDKNEAKRYFNLYAVDGRIPANQATRPAGRDRWALDGAESAGESDRSDARAQQRSVLGLHESLARVICAGVFAKT